VDEPVIYREEAVALLFTVTVVVATLLSIERLLKDDDGEETDEG